MEKISACRRILRKIELHTNTGTTKRVEARIVYIDYRAINVHAVTGIILMWNLAYRLSKQKIFEDPRVTKV